MNESNRDFRKPISYCCKKIEYELSQGDIIDYIWYTREYILRSSTVPIVQTRARFCPWCGADLGKFALYGEFWDAHERAAEEDPTLLDDSDDESDFERVGEKFLRDWESRNPIQ